MSKMPNETKLSYYERNKERILENIKKRHCPHGRVKAQCRECGGSAFCIHDTRKITCKDCKGSHVCIHNNNKINCVDCKGSQTCIHNKQKRRCRECGGADFCIHNKRKEFCVECGGASICSHNLQKRQCRICSPLLVLIHIQRHSIWRIMKSNNIHKTKPTIEYLGCSPDYFKAYIKSKMTDGMTFDNIHFDHIKPVSAFDLENEEELLNCCHYTNFQPLLIEDNLRKSSKWNDEDELFWKENICGKEYLPLYMPKL